MTTTNESDASASPWVSRVARAGYFAKGTLYAMVSVLALMYLAGTGDGQLTGSKGALSTLKDEPLGMFVLGAIIAGLLCYTAWRVMQGIVDIENKGSDGQALIKRGGLVISGIFYTVLAYSTLKIMRSGLQGPTGGSAEQRAETVMNFPGGSWLVVAFGVGFLIAAIYQLYRAFKAKFEDRWKYDLSGDKRTWATRISRFGVGARAVVFSLMGWHIMQAGFDHQAGKVQGLGETLKSFADNPVILGITATGLLCYSVYTFVNAGFRRIPAS